MAATGEHPTASPTRGTATDRAPAGGYLLASFDRAVDAAFERRRGPGAATTAAVLVSNAADYGFAWSVAAAVKGRRRGPARRRAAIALTVAGAASYTANALLKRLVDRTRPAGGQQGDGDGPLPVRRPNSSSFPSGHTLAAFCTAVVLADGPAELAAYLAFATVVGASRVQLRAHHASDVVGGALVGLAVGTAARRLAPRLATSSSEVH